MTDLIFTSNENCRSMSVVAQTERGKCFLHAQCDEMDFDTTTTQTSVWLLVEEGERLIDAAYAAGLEIVC